MAKSFFEHVEKDFTTQKAVKDKSCLDAKDFKLLLEAIHSFIGKNEDECIKVPRLWTKQNWRDLTEKFVEKEGNGLNFWNKDRLGFRSNSLLYPDNKGDIAFLAFILLKQESSKHFSNSKRKSETAVPGSNTPAQKKSKTATEALKNGEKGVAKKAADPASKTKISEDEKPADPATAAEKTKPPEGTTLFMESDGSPPPDSTDEEDVTGEKINGKNIYKSDPFQAARAAHNPRTKPAQTKTGMPATTKSSIVPTPAQSTFVVMENGVATEIKSRPGQNVTDAIDMIQSIRSYRGQSKAGSVSVKLPAVLQAQKEHNSKATTANQEAAATARDHSEMPEHGRYDQVEEASPWPDSAGKLLEVAKDLEETTNLELAHEHENERVDDNTMPEVNEDSEEDEQSDEAFSDDDGSKTQEPTNLTPNTTSKHPQYPPSLGDYKHSARTADSLPPLSRPFDPVRTMTPLYTPYLESSPWSSETFAKQSATVVFSVAIAGVQTNYLIPVKGYMSFAELIGTVLDRLHGGEGRICLARSTSCKVHCPGSTCAQSFPIMQEEGRDQVWKALMKKVFAAVCDGGPHQDEMVEMQFF